MNEFVVTIDGIQKSVVVTDEEVLVDGKSYRFEFFEKHPWAFLVRLDDKVCTVTRVTKENNPYQFLIEGNYFDAVVQSKLEARAAQIVERSAKAHHRSTVKSPMPGLVVKVKKREGDQVEAGDSVIILEAMKMENDVKSPASGTIKKVYVNERQAVEKNAPLFSVE